MKLSTFIFSASIAFSSTAVFASGGGGGGGYGGGGGFGGGQVQQRQVDQTYEVGKAIYNGRQSGFPKLSYCVVAEGEKVPVKSKSIKTYKKTSYNELSKNLYNCDNPDSLVSSELSRDGLLHVLYYLNKRYRLSLRGN